MLTWKMITNCTKQAEQYRWYIHLLNRPNTQYQIGINDKETTPTCFDKNNLFGDYNVRRLKQAAPFVLWGTWWRSRLRHCATNRKVATSISEVIIEFFNLFNPSGYTMALRSTQHLTEMSTRGISCEFKGGLYVGLTPLSPSYADCLEILAAWNSWIPKGLSRPIKGFL